MITNDKLNVHADLLFQDQVTDVHKLRIDESLIQVDVLLSDKNYFGFEICLSIEFSNNIFSITKLLLLLSLALFS